MNKGLPFKKIALIIALVVGVGFIVANVMTRQDGDLDRAAVLSENRDQQSSDLASDLAHDLNGGFLNYDIVVGDKNAPIEIIEYAAISCPHCAHFHEEVFPELKEKYLDTGRAHLIYRNFIFDNPFDVFAASITRCVSAESFFSTLETYYKSQKTWNKLADLRRINEGEGREAAFKFAKDEVIKIANTAGMSSENAQKCFANEAVLKYLLQVRGEAIKKYDISSTPTVIVGGKKLDGNDMAALDEAILALEK